MTESSPVRVTIRPRENVLAKSGEDWRKIMQTFLDSLDVREKTRETYRWGLIRYFRWMDSSGLQLGIMNPADLIRFKTALRKEKLSSLTVGAYMTAVRQFYRWTEENMIYPNIARSIRASHGKRGILKMHLTEKEAASLLVYLKGGSRRNYAMVNLILRTGLRTIEVVRADVGDVVRKNGKRILKVWGKGRDDKESFVILNDPAWLPLKDYLRSRDDRSPHSPLFETEGKGHRGKRMSARQVQYICKESLRAIGLDGHQYSAHSLRHTTAVAILKRGGDWKDVQRVLRHISPSTSQIYTATIEDEVRLEKNPESILDGAFLPEEAGHE